MSVLQSTMPSKTKGVVNSPLGVAPSITTALPGPKAKALIERDEKYSSPSYTRDYPLAVERALGSVVEDLDGNRFLDIAAGIAVCATGHCHPEVVATIVEQTRKLIHICGSDFYYPPMVDIMEKLSAITPGGPKKVLLTNSGAEAVEAAFKLARHHTNRKYAISFHGAFHGRTMGALALTSSKARQRERFSPLVPMTAQVPYGDVAAIESTLFRYQMNPSEVAAVFVEALQGEGGYIVPPANFLPDLRKLCDKHGILLVCDEIQSGVGRTGKWFAFEHFGITPDIVLMSKGLASGMPLGAVIARDNIMDWPEGAQGSTFGGNPVCCAAALAVLDTITAEGLLEHVRQVGKEIATGIDALEHPLVTEVTGAGLMIGIGLAAPVSAAVVAAARDGGYLVNNAVPDRIRLIPPLVLTEAQAREFLAALPAFLDAGRAAAGAQ
jgi:4-aminobutyrate aminotransferase